MNVFYKLCIIGSPIQHSQSPWVHAQFANQCDLVICYEKKLSALDQFHASIAQFQLAGGYGCNVTSPFKQEAYQRATHLSTRAAIAKAVNTISFQSNGTLYGDNTDGVGLLHDITCNLNYSLQGKTLLILGAGGAVRGILQPLLMALPEKIIIVNRSREKAKQLADEFSSWGKVIASDLTDLSCINVDVVIDSRGLNDHFALPKTLRLNKDSLCYDFNYTLEMTPLMQWAMDQSAGVVVNGLGMLIEQAAESFYLWTGYRPDTTSVIALARQEFYLNK